MVTIIKDKEAIYDTDKYDVVLLGLSTHNVLMGNFQGKMAVKYPIIEQVYYDTAVGDIRKLGKRITIDNLGEGKPVISIMFICTYPSRKKDFIDYEALEKCLKTANAEFKGKRVMTTVLGASRFDGRGEKEKCVEIIEKCCKDIDLYVYDYEQITIKDEIYRQRKYFKELKEKYKDNKEMISKIKDIAFEMRKKTFLPDNMYFIKKTKEEDEILNF